MRKTERLALQILTVFCLFFATAVTWTLITLNMGPMYADMYLGHFLAGLPVIAAIYYVVRAADMISEFRILGKV